MNDGHGLTKENLLHSLPPALAADQEMQALAECIAQLLARRPEEMEKTLIYPRVGQLDGPLLDLLAQDFKIDWWDSELGLEEKRRTLQTSWQVHKMLGTKAAVEKAASAAYPRTVVSEWFEYGGEPYHFRLDVGMGETEWNQERHKKLMWGLNFYKNLRSHLDAVEYHMEPIRLENKNRLLFVRQLIRLGVSNQSIVGPDGNRRRRGVELSRLLWGFSGLNRQAAASALLVRGHTRNSFSGAVGTGYRFSGCNRQQTWQAMKVSARVINVQNTRCSVTIRRDHRLNGAFLLNGTRKLNAGTTKEEL